MSRVCAIVLLVGWMFEAVGFAAPPVAFDQSRIAEITESLDELLTSGGIPGLSVALVGPGGEAQFISLGKADLESGVWVGPDTRFRVGALAETFLALGLLRVAQSGHLDIKAPADSLTPELTITNIYDRETPLRLDHLVEQTGGLEDMPLHEYAVRHETSGSVLETLKRNEKHLVVHWRPGLYSLPSTLGAMLAVRALENRTGQPFAEWMNREVFVPLGIEARYLRDSDGRTAAGLATGYLPDGTPILHPGGADLWPVLGLAASVRDLQRLLQLLIDRGRVDEAEWLPRSAIERMETPVTSIAAQQGLQVGNGFGLQTFLSGGFVFHGSEGAVDGSRASVRYLPADRVGYALLMNGGTSADFEVAQRLLSQLCTSELKPPQPLFSDLPEYRIAAVSGYYRPATSRWAWLGFWNRISGVLYIRNTVGKLEVDRLNGPSVELFPVTDRRFRAEGEPLPTVLFFRSGAGRAGLEAFSEYLEGNYRRSSGLQIWLERIVGGLIAFLSVIWILMVAWRLAGPILGRPTAVRDGLLMLLPSLAVGCLAVALLILIWWPGSMIGKFGILDGWSIGLFLLTILFAAVVPGSIVVCLLKWKKLHRDAIWNLAVVLSFFYLMVLIYLAYWGIIGIRTWQV